MAATRWKFVRLASFRPWSIPGTTKHRKLLFTNSHSQTSPKCFLSRGTPKQGNMLLFSIKCLLLYFLIFCFKPQLNTTDFRNRSMSSDFDAAGNVELHSRCRIGRVKIRLWPDFVHAISLRRGKLNSLPETVVATTAATDLIQKRSARNGLSSHRVI